ncbi:MAG: hypothetical protein AAGG48_22905 [Planctomycetota bacterium]
MGRLFLNLSTTAAVVLFTIGALSMVEAGNYVLASVFLFFVFYVPLQDDLDQWVRQRFKLNGDPLREDSSESISVKERLTERG